MKLPKFLSLFFPRKPKPSPSDLDLTHSDFMRAKYGLPSTYEEEPK